MGLFSFVKNKNEYANSEEKTHRIFHNMIKNNATKEKAGMDMDKEDFLLNQIDEFREKAKQLQNLLTNRETKVKELQNIVDEREGKAQELQDILEEKQKQADSVNAEVSKQMEILIAKIDEKLDQVCETIDDKVDSLKETDAVTEELKAVLGDTHEQLNKTKTDITDKIHSENVQCFRNIKDLFADQDEKFEQISELKNQIQSTKSYLKVLSWFSIVNFIVLMIYILYSLGVFNF